MAYPNKQNSDSTGLSYAEEIDLKQLPAGSAAVWRELEPNTYSDTGGDVSTVSRDPIRRSRQRLKGSPTDIDVTAGFNQDLTQRNFTRLLQGFFFADAFEKPKTRPFNGPQLDIGSVATDGYVGTSGLTAFDPGDIVNARSFGIANNNGIFIVSASTAGKVSTTKTLTAEASPPAAAHLSAVGFQFASGDIALTIAAGIVTLTATAGVFNNLGLNVGEFIFVGGDALTTRYDNNVGYARIKSIAAKTIVLDKTTWTPQAETGAGKTLQIYFGNYLRNATSSNPELIKRRSYNIERTLGNDGDGNQAQYLEGAVPNMFTLNIPGQNKVTADVTFVALNEAFRTGLQGLKPGSRVTSLGEAAYNTSIGVIRQRLTILDPNTLNPTSLYAYITEGTAVINNNVSVDKAVGVFGGFDTSLGNFEVSGSVTAYFSSVTAVSAIRNNADVTLDFIMAQKNGAIIYDLPLLSLGGGRLTIEKSRPVMLPLTTNGAENEAGYTLSMTFLDYVPTVGMPASL